MRLYIVPNYSASIPWISSKLIATTVGVAIFLLVCLSCCHAQEKRFVRTDADLQFGVSQVKQIVLDRSIGAVTVKHPNVVKWMEDCFSGVYIGERIYWIDKAPLSGRLGEYEAGNENHPTMIRISKQLNITDYDRLAVLVYELHNSKRMRDAWKVYNRAVAGEFNAVEYATKCLEIEHSVLLECKNFLIEHSIPSEGNTYVREHLNVENDFKVFLSKLKDRDEEAIKFFVRFYEMSITPQQKGVSSGGHP